jgi:hypothetical protein
VRTSDATPALLLLLLLLLLQVIDQSDELAALGLPVGFGRQQVRK